MSENAACKTFWPSLSPFVDGELSPAERTALERHLASCPDCTGRVADFRAEAGLVRLGLEMLADDADFSGFAQKVMARVSPVRLPFGERLRLAWNESWAHQRGLWMSGVALAAAMVLMISVGLRFQSAATRLPAHLAVQSISVDPGAHVAPVVMTNAETGDSIIWLVDHDDHLSANESKPDDSSKDELPPDESTHRPSGGVLPRERPSGGDL